MSRVPASRSRSDKSRPLPAAPPPPQTGEDVIPGRFTQEDWLAMAASEDGEEAVWEALDSLMGGVMDQCYKVYLEGQRIPYTISQARDTMIRMVDWAFIPRDEGEDEGYPESPEQQEPQPCSHDSWAQGCVPISRPVLTPRSSRPQVSSITDIAEQETEAQEEKASKSYAEDPPPLHQELEEAQKEASAAQQPRPIIKPSHQEPEEAQKEASAAQQPLPIMKPSHQEPEEAQKVVSAAQQPWPIMKPTPPPEPPKTRTKFRPYRGPLRSAGLRNIGKSLEETEKEMFLEDLLNARKETSPEEDLDLLPTSLHNILKIQLGRPPQKKDVVYDDAGNVLSVPKLDLSRLPQHHVRPRVEVLDSDREAQCQVKKFSHADVRTSNKQPHDKRRIRKKGHLGQARATGRLPVSSAPDLPHKTLQVYTLSSSTSTDLSQGPRPSSTGLLLDHIQLAHGVILREANNTERGSLHSLRQSELARREESRQLQPIRPSVALPSLSVEQLIKNNTPQVQPMVTFMRT
ncbi:uncharacterized protein C2orf81 homolog [Gastrophryne carolinensis]